ncbi:MAG: DUF1330 domain-containing protein [Alphaproteobacteria bacterium]|nr:DUF1330 domain-containing protein [Alphaproteobacteria bacterium]
MAKGYWVFQATVNDPETYKKYVTADGPVFAKFGAKFLVRGGANEVVEGKARARQVVIEFDSYEQALACYRSPEYQAIAKYRFAAADADVVIVRGVD